MSEFLHHVVANREYTQQDYNMTGVWRRITVGSIPQEIEEYRRTLLNQILGSDPWSLATTEQHLAEVQDEQL
jgi:hypothetical protein